MAAKPIDSDSYFRDEVCVRRALARWLVVLALTFSVGAHWALLQSVAWLGMAVVYVKVAPLKEALSKTFDGQHPCKICKFVREGQQSSQKSEHPPADIRLDLVLDGTEVFLNWPEMAPLSRFEGAPWSVRALAPPLPPPRRA